MTLEMSKYLQVRKAQAQGARTIEELKEEWDITYQLFFQLLIAEGYLLPHFSSTKSKADKASASLTALYTVLKFFHKFFGVFI